MSEELRLTGLAAAPGVARGPVRLLSAANMLDALPPGSVLVTRLLHPHQAPLLARAAAVITEEGSLLQHATTLAREFGIPAVVGVRGATHVLREGSDAHVDGHAGLVLVRTSDEVPSA